MSEEDLKVTPYSNALLNKKVDLVVCGSIAAVESVRLIRALRRLGATVQPWMSQGAQQFISKTALSWAAALPSRDSFSGHKSHIATNTDAIIVAPASANFLAKIATGLIDSAPASLVTSAICQKKPVLILATMHDDLYFAPSVQENIRKIKAMGAHICFLEAREEEGKKNSHFRQF